MTRVALGRSLTSGRVKTARLVQVYALVVVQDLKKAGQSSFYKRKALSFSIIMHNSRCGTVEANLNQPITVEANLKIGQCAANCHCYLKKS